MSGIDGVGAPAGHGAIESHDFDAPSAGSTTSGASKGGMASMFGDAAKNSIGQFASQGLEQMKGQQGGAPDFMSIIGTLFGGPIGAALATGNAMELGGILGKIFDLIGKAGGQGGNAQPTADTSSSAAASKPEAKSNVEHTTTTDHQLREANRSRDYVGVQEKVEVSGSYKDEGIEMQGRAAAEAHAHASAESESYNANGRVGAKVKADASVGASAEVEGSIKTDVAQIEGRARVSAEAAARAQAEASAGLDGLNARASSEVGVKSDAKASSNMSALGGMVTGEADAWAEAGAGAKADARATVSFAPPQAAVDAEAGAFAGARAGFSAKGGFPGGKVGITANVHAGAGARIELHGELGADGKYRLAFGFGAAVAVGFSFRIDVEIDMKDAGSAISGIFGAANQIISGLFQMVGGMFGGGQGDGSKANSVIGDAAKNVGPMLSQFAGKNGMGNAVTSRDNDDTKLVDESHEESGGWEDSVETNHTIEGSLT